MNLYLVRHFQYVIKNMKIIKKFLHLFHRHKEKPYKRVLMVAIPVVVALLIILASQLIPHGQSGYLKYEKKVFARVTEKEGVIFLDKPVYQRGEPVHFALVNVGPFKRDEEGKNWVDMDLLVKDPAGNVAMKKEHLLGNGGHLKLDNDTAPSPDGVYVPGLNVKLGKYFVSIRIYDRIGGGEVSDSGTFEIIRENPTTQKQDEAKTAPADKKGNTRSNTK